MVSAATCTAAVNLAYDEVETRNFAKLKVTSLLLTLGAIVFVLITWARRRRPDRAGGSAAGRRRNRPGPGGPLGLLLEVFAGALAVLYRVAPDRDDPKLRWVSLGSIAVTIVWALVSLGFSFYVDRFGSYDKTYGAIAGVIVLMLWLYLTCYLVLLGAEINEAEHETAQDTTSGEAQPMGERDAKMADTLPESGADEGRQRPDPEAVAPAHVRGTNGGRTTCGCAPTDVDGGARRPPRSARRCRAAPARSRCGVGENVPLVTSPTRSPAASRTDMPGRGIPLPSARSPHSCRAGPACFSASSASRPQNRGFFQPTAQPTRAWIRRDVPRQLVAVQRVAHLGAQRVRAPSPQGRMPRSWPASRTASHISPARSAATSAQ